MALSTGALAIEFPTPSQPKLIPSIPSDDVARVNKRPRDWEPASPRPQGIDLVNTLGSPSKVARISLATAARAVVPSTSAAALEDERRRQVQDRTSASPPTTPNLSHAALKFLLLGSETAMSRPSDAAQVAPTASMEPAVKAASALSMATGDLARSADHEDFGRTTNANSAALTSVAESPTAMDVDVTKNDQVHNQENLSPGEKHQPGSLSYPGPLQTAAAALVEPPARGMSFPSPGQGQDSPPAHGAKKHKCPYCSTEFTRHHNLKSHLLTHSQEKPYVCTECQMRFRRLHDLKRHGKLHTGEKPHICAKCDRKFARGDALARHSKGAGGCAGRRASMGSFADGDDLDGTMGEGDDSNMSGVAYDNADDDELRHQSLSGIGAQHPSGDGYAAHSRTYPPVGPRAAASSLYPPNHAGQQSQLGTTGSSSVPDGMNGIHTANTSVSSVPGGSGGAGMYSHTGMTESPRPLSPGLPGHETTDLARQKSPSMSQPFSQQQQQQQQQRMGRRLSDLASPHSGQARPKLPALSHPSFAGPNSGSYTHGRTPSGTQNAVDSGNMFAQSDPSVWEYMRLLEDKIKTLSDKVTSLDHEVTSLKKQLEVLDRDGAQAG